MLGLAALTDAIRRSGRGHPLPDGDLLTSDEPYADELEPAQLSIPAPAATLAEALASAPDFDTAAAAVRDILAEGGITVTNIGAPIREGNAPKTWIVDHEIDVLIYALHARGADLGATMTLDELGRSLSLLGWPTGADPGRTFGRFFAEWTAAALEEPEDPTSFAPLFVAALAEKRSPRVNILESAEQHPEDVKLSSLELALLLAAFDRVVPQTPAPRLWADGPCTAIAKRFGALGELGANVAPIPTDLAIERAFRRLGDTGISSNAITAAGTFQKIENLAILYKTSALRVETAELMLHKPGRSEPEKQSRFRAVVGLDLPDVDRFIETARGMDPATRSAINDCLSIHGLPSLPRDPSDLIEDLPGWRVAWMMTKGEGTLAKWTPGMMFDIISRKENAVTVEPGGTRASDEVSVNVMREMTLGHSGRTKKSKLQVRAELKTSKPPSMRTFINAGRGPANLADSFVEVGAGLFQDLVTKKAYATVIVEEHVFAGWSGYIRAWEVSDEYQSTWRADNNTGDFNHLTLSAMAAEEIIVLGGPDDRPLVGDLHGVITTRCEVKARSSGQMTDQGEGDMCTDSNGMHVPCRVRFWTGSLHHVGGVTGAPALDVGAGEGLPASLSIASDPYVQQTYMVIVVPPTMPCGSGRGYYLLDEGIAMPMNEVGTVDYRPFTGVPPTLEGPWSQFAAGHIFGGQDFELARDVNTPIGNHRLMTRYHVEWDLHRR